MPVFDRFRNSILVRCGALALLTLLLRILGASGPYFADSSRHIRAIESGLLVIHAPGYILFNTTGFFLAHLLHLSAGSALQVLNITFSVAGSVVFYLLLTRFPGISSPFWLALVYVCSPVVWFSGDVHCTYAAAAFFAPLLILVVEGERRFVLGCVVWALMTGFRPSDGVFVLPWMVFRSLRFGWRERLTGIAAAVPIVAAWWIPTVARYGGGWLSPLRYSGEQVQGLAQGVLTGQLALHALVNAAHAAAGMIMTWGVLTAAVCLEMAASVRRADARSMTIFLVPGLAFFLLYFVSDAPYFAFAAAAGMVLAGERLAKWPDGRRRLGYAAAICASVLFMLCARTVDGTASKMRAVADAYFLKYSVPSLREQRDPRLASLLGACGDSSVRGICR